MGSAIMKELEIYKTELTLVKVEVSVLRKEITCTLFIMFFSMFISCRCSSKLGDIHNDHRFFFSLTYFL